MKKDISYLAFNFVSTIAVTVINKICFSRVEFGFPAALCNIHFLITLLGVEILYRLKYFQRVNVNYKDINFIAICVVVGLVTPLNNTSLKLNSIGFYQIFKLLVTPVVVLLEYCLDGKTLSFSRTVALIAVCIMVFVSSRGDLLFNKTGTLCATLWVPLAAIYKVQWGRVRNICQCSTLALMRAVLPFAICVQAAISPIVDPPGIMDFVWTKEAFLWIGLSGVAAFMVNFSGFLVIGNISALAHVLLGQFKTAIIMVLATVIFGSRYSAVQLLGAVGAVIAIVVYSHVTIAEKQQYQQTKEDSSLEKQQQKDMALPLVNRMR